MVELAGLSSIARDVQVPVYEENPTVNARRQLASQAPGAANPMRQTDWPQVARIDLLTHSFINQVKNGSCHGEDSIAHAAGRRAHGAAVSRRAGA
ncbi:MAG: hypothetical protein J5X21_02265 [Candidatus Accumulibacter sp.]|nr:hypothetical protein [Candidatus Accumulibacter conexus]